MDSLHTSGDLDGTGEHKNQSYNVSIHNSVSIGMSDVGISSSDISSVHKPPQPTEL